MKFTVIVPVYNGAEYIHECLHSIYMQEFKNFTVVIVDDASTDGTADLARTYSKYVRHNVIENEVHNGSALENIKKGMTLSDKDDIIVTVDGDDKLADNKVLSYLNALYHDDVWMTYGSFLPLSGKYKNTCQPLDKIHSFDEFGNWVDASLTTDTYRKSRLWCTSHLRTFRRGLWDRIKDEDLRDESGEYFKVAWDLAFMYPMIEMAGDHVKFIDKILYLYNDLNPQNDSKVRTKEQLETARYIQNKECYGRISDIF